MGILYMAIWLNAFLPLCNWNIDVDICIVTSIITIKSNKTVITFLEFNSDYLTRQFKKNKKRSKGTLVVHTSAKSLNYVNEHLSIQFFFLFPELLRQSEASTGSKLSVYFTACGEWVPRSVEGKEKRWVFRGNDVASPIYKTGGLFTWNSYPNRLESEKTKEAPEKGEAVRPTQAQVMQEGVQNTIRWLTGEVQLVGLAWFGEDPSMREVYKMPPEDLYTLNLYTFITFLTWTK